MIHSLTQSTSWDLFTMHWIQYIGLDSPTRPTETRPDVTPGTRWRSIPIIKATLLSASDDFIWVGDEAVLDVSTTDNNPSGNYMRRFYFTIIKLLKTFVTS